MPCGGGRGLRSCQRWIRATSCVAAHFLALSVCSVVAVHADTLPPFKPGLWETKTITNGVTRTTKDCIKDQADRETDRSAHRHCQRTVARTAVGYDVSMQCAFGPATGESVTHVTGDFETTVRMETIATPDDPRRSEPTTVSMIKEMRRLGPCEAERQ